MSARKQISKSTKKEISTSGEVTEGNIRSYNRRGKDKGEISEQNEERQDKQTKKGKPVKQGKGKKKEETSEEEENKEEKEDEEVEEDGKEGEQQKIDEEVEIIFDPKEQPIEKMTEAESGNEQKEEAMKVKEKMKAVKKPRNETNRRKF